MVPYNQAMIQLYVRCMMKKLSKTLLMSPAVSLVLPAALFVSFNSAYASLVDTSQNQTFESRPQAAAVSKRPVSSPFIKLAAVHFIANDGNLSFGNQEFLPEDICKQGGYTHKGCPAGYVKGEACPEDGSYVKDCIDPDTWCKNNGYEVTGCQVPQYPQGACPYGSGYYKSCETDNIRACKELGYSLTCEAGKVGDTNQSCPYNESYKKCVCNPCEGYDYTASEANAQGYTPGEVCNSCGTMKYKRSANSCDGFKECTDGGAAGAEVCYSGSLKKFSECKEVCDPKFQYDSSNCTGGKVLTGNSCGGKYEKCILPAKILYGDGTTSYDLITGKVAIGVVINDGDGGYVRQGKAGRYIAMALTDVRKDGTPGSEEMLWSTETCDTSLENCLCPTDAGEAWTVGCGDNGKINTQTLLRETCGGIYEAAEAVNLYEPAGCEKDFCRKGNWFYPSNWEVQYLGGYAVKLTLDKLSNNGYIVEDTDGKEYWGSSEGDAETVTSRSISHKWYNPGYLPKKDKFGNYVRPLIEF